MDEIWTELEPNYIKLVKESEFHVSNWFWSVNSTMLNLYKQLLFNVSTIKYL